MYRDEASGIGDEGGSLSSGKTVEVEPSGGDQAFTIPARFIQNNRGFENCAIWLSQNGQWKQPEWLYKKGTAVSPYGIENIISFSEQ